MFKYLLLTTVVSSVFCVLHPKHLPPAMVKLSTESHQGCRLVTGATEEEINSLRQGNLNGRENIKRYAACQYIHSGLFDHKLTLNTTLLQILEPEILQGKGDNKGFPMWTKCYKMAKEVDLNTIGDDFHEVIWKITKCIHDGDPEHFYFP